MGVVGLGASFELLAVVELVDGHPRKHLLGSCRLGHAALPGCGLGDSCLFRLRGEGAPMPSRLPRRAFHGFPDARCALPLGEGR